METSILFHTSLTKGFVPLAIQCLSTHYSVRLADVGFLVHFIGTYDEFKEVEEEFDRKLNSKYRKKVWIFHVNINEELENLQKRNEWSLTKEEIFSGKRHVENRTVNDSNLTPEERRKAVLWKQFISVEVRYRSLITLAYDFGYSKEFDYLVHIDADMLSVGDINALLKFVGNADIGLIYRPYRDDLSKIFGTLLVFKINGEGSEFLDSLKEEIDKVDFSEQPKGFGQLALYRSFLRNHEKISYLPEEVVSSRFVDRKSVYFSGNRGYKSTQKIIFMCVGFLKKVGAPLFVINQVLYLRHAGVVAGRAVRKLAKVNKML